MVQTKPLSIIYSVSHCDVPNFHYTAIKVLDHLCGGCLPFQQKDFSQGNTLAYLLEIVCLGSEVLWGRNSAESVIGRVREIRVRLKNCTMHR